jgi:hypothetical protein
MALASASGLASFDQSAGEFLDLSNELAEIIRRDNTAFISRVGISGVATETLHSWMEDQLNPNTATMAESGGLNNSKTDIDVASGHGVRFKIGTLFRVVRAGSTEVMQVTAISTDNLTITRGYGSTSAQDHGSTTNYTLQIIANPAQESQDAPADESRARTKVSNYTQIFQKGIKTSHTMRSVLQAGVADEFTFQIARRLMEIMRELDSSVINGISSGSQGSDSVYRSMGGIIEFASQAGGNVNTTSEALTPSVINAMVKQIWDDGGTPNFILVGGTLKRAISAFDQSYRRMSYDGNTAGYVVDKFVSDLGFMLDVIVDPWMPDDVCIVGDLSKVRVLPLRDDAMRAEELAKTGRSWNAQVTGQYTAEFRNAKEAFAYHNNLS